MDAGRWAKGAVGLIVLIALFVVVLTWIGDYRAAQSLSSTNTETTATVTGAENATAQPEAAQVLVVQVQGLNLRQEPSGTSRAHRGLAKGERVVLISQEGEWYKVRDSAGTVGYITANPAYTKKAAE